MLSTCPNCSASIDVDAVFCMTCGKAVSQTILCPKCRGTLTFEAKFCKYCAFDLSLSEQKTIEQPSFADTPTVAVPQMVIDPPVLSEQSVSETKEQEDKKVFITPSSAGFAIICFFLPWVEYSCGGFGGRSLSGSDLASMDSSLWLVPLIAGAIIGAFFYFRSQKKPLVSIPVTMALVAFALSFLFYKAHVFGRGVNTPFGGIGFEMLGFSLQFGGFLTAISFAAAWLGLFFLLPSAGASSQTLSQNKAAAICYLLFPLPYLTWLIAPLIFIFKEPYKTNKFIRFHAIQAILLGIFHTAVLILITMMFILFDFTKPAYARGANSAAIALLSIFLSTGFVALAGFLAYRSAMNQTVKISFLGDVATNLVDRDIQFPSIKS